MRIILAIPAIFIGLAIYFIVNKVFKLLNLKISNTLTITISIIVYFAIGMLLNLRLDFVPTNTYDFGLYLFWPFLFLLEVLNLQ